MKQLCKLKNSNFCLVEYSAICVTASKTDLYRILKIGIMNYRRESSWRL